MTAQINDEFRYRDHDYDLAGISGGELFDPEALGLRPSPSSSACWRGWQAVYALDGPHLVLEALNVNLVGSGDARSREREQGPPINGVTPVDRNRELDRIEDEHERMLLQFANSDFDFNNHYGHLSLRLPYTGGLLLADGFIDELYEHMGFHPAWKYERVVELVFEDGVLKLEQDRSAAMAELRAMVLEGPFTPGPGPRPSDDDIRRYVERAFDRSY